MRLTTSSVSPVSCPSCTEKEFVIDNLLVRSHFIIVMIRWTGLAPWETRLSFSRLTIPGGAVCAPGLLFFFTLGTGP